MKRYFSILILLLLASSSFAQYGKGDFNHIGLSLGVNQTHLFTNNFNVNPGMSWTAGLAIRGNYYNDFAMVYGMNFTDNLFKVETNSLLGTKEVELKMMAVQVHLLLSYKIAGSNFSIDAGPVLQINSKIKFDEADADLFIANAGLLRVENLEEISPINCNAHIGLTGGFDNVRLNLSFQYGITNVLNNLNKQDEVKLVTTEKLKGNLGILAANIIVYF